jgi:hypothetical protein
MRRWLFAILLVLQTLGFATIGQCFGVRADPHLLPLPGRPLIRTDLLSLFVLC